MSSMLSGLVRRSNLRVQQRFFDSHPDGIARTRRFPLYLHRDSHFLSVAVIRRGEWEPVTTRLLESLLEGSSTMVDVGANIGWHTLVAARVARRVWAFEPEPSNVALLRRNVELNRLGNVTVVPKAVADHAGTIDLWLSETSAGHHSTSHVVGRRKLQVPSTTLDTEFPVETIDVLKIDTEGAEPQVLAGAEALIASRRIKNIVLEWKPEAWVPRDVLSERFDAYTVDDQRPFTFRGRPREENIYLRPKGRA